MRLDEAGEKSSPATDVVARTHAHPARLWRPILCMAVVAAGLLVLPASKPAATPLLLHDVLTAVSQKALTAMSEDALMEKAARGLVGELDDPYAERWLTYEQPRTAAAATGIGALLLTSDNSDPTFCR